MKKTCVRMGFWFLCGAILYPAVEVIWRGYTHWSMSLAGGACALLLLYLNGLFSGLARPFRALLGGIVICLVEFLFGVVFNLFLGMAVWDYSDLTYHLLGQVSLRYFFLWSGLSFGLTYLFDRVWAGDSIREKIFRAAV